LKRYKQLRAEGRESFALNYLGEENKLSRGFGVGLKEFTPHVAASLVVSAALGREEVCQEGVSGFDDKPEHVVLGYWKDSLDGHEYIDYGVVVERLSDAVSIGKQHNQKAIYSFEYGRDVRLDDDLGNHHYLPLVFCLHCELTPVCPECYPTGVCLFCMSPQEVHKHENEFDLHRLDDDGGIVLTTCAYCEKEKGHEFWCPIALQLTDVS
jgi:hypothetical protein